MKTYAFRLNPGDDLKKELLKSVREKKVKAGCILTCVGSLNGVNVRVADGKTEQSFEGQYEIVSLVGTLEEGDAHLHISFSDLEGNVFGGHLKEGCLIHTTAEIVVGIVENVIFKREFDNSTGYDELKITKK